MDDRRNALSEIEQASSPRRQLLLIACVILAVLIIGAWSYGWSRARGLVVQNFDAFLAREARAGRMHECANLKVGGYPFHIEISCDATVVRFMEEKGQITARFAYIKSVALVYAPTHVITEFGAPLIVEQNGQTLLQANFKNAQASYSQGHHGFERFSLSVDDWQLEAPVQASAKYAEVHLRPSAAVAEDAGRKNFDFAAEAEKLVTPGAAPDQPMDVSFAATLHNWPGWGVSSEAVLSEWLQAEGKIDVQDLRIRRNAGLFFSKGEVHFNPQRRAEGRFDATFVNSPALLRGLLMQGQVDAGALFGPLLQMLGKPVDVEGQRAAVVQLKVENGVFKLGNLVLGEFSPLY